MINFSHSPKNVLNLMTSQYTQGHTCFQSLVFYLLSLLLSDHWANREVLITISKYLLMINTVCSVQHTLHLRKIDVESFLIPLQRSARPKFTCGEWDFTTHTLTNFVEVFISREKINHNCANVQIHIFVTFNDFYFINKNQTSW